MILKKKAKIEMASPPVEQVSDSVQEKEREVIEKQEESTDIEEKPSTEKDSDETEEDHRWVVVKEIPVQQVRESVTEDGTILHYITVEEALTQFINQA